MTTHPSGFRATAGVDKPRTGAALTTLVLGTTLAVGLCLTPTAPAGAQAAPEIIASGLANPRGLGFAANGALYVAEAGAGGPGPCIPSPSQPVQRCYGDTGAVSQVLPGGVVVRILSNLPSLALPNGTVEGGAVDVSFHGSVAYVQMGWGGDPALRHSSLGRNSKLLGRLLRVTPGGQYQVVADVAGHETKFNPASGTLDSNPYGVLALPGRRIVADAGANAVIEVLANGRTRTLSLLPDLPGGRQSVPTSVAEGPDGALYVGQLTGFPFFAGTASVHRIESDGSSSSVYVAGFTAIVDVAFDTGGALYVLEVASGQQAPFPPPSPGLGNGRLKRVCPGGAPEVLLAGLVFPGGVAIGPDGGVYLTNFGTSAAGGQVLRLAVPACP